jgi:hypothetical protein
MKTPLILLALCAMICAGCKTTGGQSTITPGRVATVAEFAAFEGATIWLAKHPEDRLAFEVARDALTVLYNGTNATPADVRAVFEKLPIKELKGSEGAVYIGGAIILYDALVRENVNLDSNEWLKPVILGLKHGLDSAL